MRTVSMFFKAVIYSLAEVIFSLLLFLGEKIYGSYHDNMPDDGGDE